ncbi:MAG: hypothetical protein U0802_06070 [Candidatus Binatia bacterium]
MNWLLARLKPCWTHTRPRFGLGCGKYQSVGTSVPLLPQLTCTSWLAVTTV